MFTQNKIIKDGPLNAFSLPPVSDSVSRTLCHHLHSLVWPLAPLAITHWVFRWGSERVPSNTAANLPRKEQPLPCLAPRTVTLWGGGTVGEKGSGTRVPGCWQWTPETPWDLAWARAPSPATCPKGPWHFTYKHKFQHTVPRTSGGNRRAFAPKRGSLLRPALYDCTDTLPPDKRGTVYWRPSHSLLGNFLPVGSISVLPQTAVYRRSSSLVRPASGSSALTGCEGFCAYFWGQYQGALSPPR